MTFYSIFMQLQNHAHWHLSCYVEWLSGAQIVPPLFNNSHHGEKTMMFPDKNLLAGAVLACSSTMASAASELRMLVDMLHENGTVNDAQYQRLLQELENGAKKEAAKTLAAAPDVEIDLKKGLTVRTTDGEFEAKVGGRLQADAAWYGEDGPGMGDGTEIRRARIAIEGKAYRDWGYKFEFDFVDSGSKGIRDAYVNYQGFDDITLTAGNIKEPWSLQEQTSANYITFMERALPTAFNPGRDIGFTASYDGGRWTATGGIFGDKVEKAGADKNESWGAGARFTYAPIMGKNRLLMVGASGNYRRPRGKNTVQFKTQPETHIAGLNLADTGVITDVDNFWLLGLETAAVYGPFSAQAEYMRSSIDRSQGEDPDFDGWYVEGSYFLTGESKNYKKDRFGAVTPNSIVGHGGIGAWEVALRYSALDLNDADVDGGDEENLTAGLNWYPTPSLRFSANYVKVLNMDGGKFDDAEPDLLQARMQVVF